MQLVRDSLRLSAGDLTAQVACRHLLQLDLLAAHGRIPREYRDDPILDRLKQRGLEFEQAYLEQLGREGVDIVDLRTVEGDTAVERTRNAMREGKEAIAQATLADGRWYGRADLLRRIDTPSKLGDWSYEVVDTKLTHETRGTTVLQLCLYTELVAAVQGRTSETMYVVRPGEGGEPECERHRFDDYSAYYRLVKKRLQQVVDTSSVPAEVDPDDPEQPTYPHPVAHCELCSWWPRCNEKRRADDHLGFVAGLQTTHRVELEGRDLKRLQTFAECEQPLHRPPTEDDDKSFRPGKPTRGSAETYERLHRQARTQLEGREQDRPVHHLVTPPTPGEGLTRLPEPNAGDVFFDIESSRYAGDHGLEYLFGWCDADGHYHREWADGPTTEKRMFRDFIDMLSERWERHDGMHVYHFGGYESGALKRLMNRYATRAAEVDRLLRAERLIDLHAVTRQGVVASVEKYSLKDLEAHTGYARQTPLESAREALQAMDAALESNVEPDPEAVVTVERYNREDCESTRSLRDWLEDRRSELEKIAGTIDRPELKTGLLEEDSRTSEEDAETQALFEALIRDVPDDPEERSEDQKAQWLLAHMLDYFRREEKVAFWELVRMRDLDDDELLDERKALSGLELVEQVGGSARHPHHQYRFPVQECDIREGDQLYDPHAEKVEQLGTVKNVDREAGTVVIGKSKNQGDRHPHAVSSRSRIPYGQLRASMFDVARFVEQHGMDADGPHRAVRDVLLRRPPRLAGIGPGEPLRRSGERALDAAKRVVLALDGGTLPIQGPPGSGKTYTGAHMILALARAGRRVGVTAVSHPAIANLMEKVANEAATTGDDIALTKKGDKGVSDGSPIRVVTSNQEAEDAIAPGAVVGGTAWLWARDQTADSLDVLFVDEAGQQSLTALVAASRAARNLVLLGDPQQLEQPQQALHPEGSGTTALEHLLDDARTIAEDQGLFLELTYRLHPEICEFTSGAFYEDKLHSAPDRDRQVLTGTDGLDGAGLTYKEEPHSGNQSRSTEEAEAVKGLVERLTRPGATWTDSDGIPHPLTREDILVVAPYNAQVTELQSVLGDGIRVGTVDRFQGQQAPVVIYSMASSSVEDAPRGIDFAFNPNRLNVATSRAQCRCILVASPALMAPECRTPREMRFANGVCRYLELADRTP